MRDHSIGKSILTIFSALALVCYLVFFSTTVEENTVTAEQIIEEIAPEDRDKLTTADKTTYVEDTKVIEMGYDMYYDEPEYSMGGGILTIKKGGC